MPELPDINTYLSALDTRIVGRTLERVRPASPFVLRTAEPAIISADEFREALTAENRTLKRA